MTTLAFATCRARPEITADDALVAAELPPDFELVSAPWDGPARDWGELTAIVVRSTWDYHLRRREFEGWLDELDRAAARVWNPTAVMRWNLEKTYLRGLADRGVEVVPTRWLERHETADLEDLVAESGGDRVVVKPTVGASSAGLLVVDRDTARSRQPDLDAALAKGGVMVQPLVDEVGAVGEWSLVFLGGELSHAVIKRAPAGEVRVQSDFGGTAEATRPPPALGRWAARVVEVVGSDLLYARVDAVETDGGPLLMELELIEPQLFLGGAPGAAARFAEAFVARL